MPNFHILLVEDNPDDVLLTQLALAKGKTVSPDRLAVVRTGAEALARLTSRAAEPLPALVLLDLNLPDMDGKELIRRIRTNERTASLPVVVLTASRVEEDMVQSWDLGADAYLSKPVDDRRLQTVLNRLKLLPVN